MNFLQKFFQKDTDRLVHLLDTMKNHTQHNFISQSIVRLQ